jgi:hypothetical protein
MKTKGSGSGNATPGLKLRTHVKAAGRKLNRNEALIRDAQMVRSASVGRAQQPLQVHGRLASSRSTAAALRKLRSSRPMEYGVSGRGNADPSSGPSRATSRARTSGIIRLRVLVPAQSN